MLELAALKTLIGFFYMLNGDIVSYTVSDYGAFQEDAGILPEWTCEMLIREEGFAADVKTGLEKGESMRAECYVSEDIRNLGEPSISITIAPE
ncbi:MAG: hypothetical protein ACE363_05800 [Alphaproteobacteria bacterium]